MNNLQDAVQKLDDADATVITLLDQIKKTQVYGKDHISPVVRDVLTAIRRAKQLVQEEQGKPDVKRQKFERQEDPTNNLHDQEERHESYGLVSITKPTGGMRLIGSMVDRLPTAVEVRVHRARRLINNDTCSEFWFPESGLPVLSFRMSVYQWAEAISNTNGVGVPCTLKDVLGVDMEEPPEEARTPFEQIAHEARKRARAKKASAGEDFLQALDELKDHVDTLKLSKKKADEVKALITKLGKEFHSRPLETAAWVSQRLAEESEKTVSQAKVEIAAALGQTLQAAGLQALQEKLGLTEGDLLPQLKGKSEDK